MVCNGCRRRTALRHVWAPALYDGPVRKLIRAYKFERVQAARKPLAEAMLGVLPYPQDQVVVVPVPTATVRVRQRGYDQAALLARDIARARGWAYATPLRRLHSQRQVGASRAVRLQQAETAFELIDSAAVAGKHVLLVDDVTTSGATLCAASRLLAQAGALQVDAVTAAKHILE